MLTHLIHPSAPTHLSDECAQPLMLTAISPLANRNPQPAPAPSDKGKHSSGSMDNCSNPDSSKNPQDHLSLISAGINNSITADQHHDATKSESFLPEYCCCALTVEPSRSPCTYRRWDQQLNYS